MLERTDPRSHTAHPRTPTHGTPAALARPPRGITDTNANLQRKGKAPPTQGQGTARNRWCPPRAHASAVAAAPRCRGSGARPAPSRGRFRGRRRRRKGTRQAPRGQGSEALRRAAWAPRGCEHRATKRRSAPRAPPHDWRPTPGRRLVRARQGAHVRCRAPCARVAMHGGVGPAPREHRPARRARLLAASLRLPRPGPRTPCSLACGQPQPATPCPPTH